MSKSEFNLLMEADTRLSALETKGYKIYPDKFGGIMVKGPALAIYSHIDEYKGANEGERIWKQVEALCRELGETGL